MPPSRPVVIDNDDLSAWPYHAKKLTQRSLPILAGLLVQEKEYEGAIIARIWQVQVARIHCQQSNRRVSRQFLAQIAELYRQHVDDVHAPAFGDACAQPSAQVTIDAGDLQSASRQRVSHFCHDGVTQSAVIAPKNEIDQPLPLEQLYRRGMNIGPPIVGIKIIRHLEFGWAQWQRRYVGAKASIRMLLATKERRRHRCIALRRQVPLHRSLPGLLMASGNTQHCW